MGRFSQADIHEFAPALIDALLKKVEQGGSAEKVAENDYLMKCTLDPLPRCAVVRLILRRCDAGDHHRTVVGG